MRASLLLGLPSEQKPEVLREFQGESTVSFGRNLTDRDDDQTVDLWDELGVG